MMSVNSLPKPVTRQRQDRDLNPSPSAPESSALTTLLPSHPLCLKIHQFLSSIKKMHTKEILSFFLPHGVNIIYLHICFWAERCSRSWDLNWVMKLFATLQRANSGLLSSCCWCYVKKCHLLIPFKFTRCRHQTVALATAWNMVSWQYCVIFVLAFCS